MNLKSALAITMCLAILSMATTVEDRLVGSFKSNDIYFTEATVPLYPDPDTPMVALTFDDGPSAVSTGVILDLLEETGGYATFFTLGHRVNQYPEVVKRMYDMGCEVASHGNYHNDFTKLSEESLYWELWHAKKAVFEATGEYPTMIRPPFGNSNAKVREIAGLPFVLWDVDPRDWESLDEEKVSQAVLDTVFDGCVVILHDVHKSTAEACETIIPELTKRGYQLVTVSQLFEAKGVALETGAIYRGTLKASK